MRVFGLIGFPLSHSFSPAYFGEKFKREHIQDAEYKLFPITSIDEFPALLQEIKIWSGLNVTIPYKQSIIKYIHHLTPEAKSIGAVNCIKQTHNGIVGHNTDYIGFMESLVPLLQPHDKRALILGSGGASKAVQFGLKELNIPYKVVSRSGSSDLNYSDLNSDIFKDFSIIVNTTPLGTYPNTDEHPELPFQCINSNHLVFDLVYNPSLTNLMSRAADCGARVVNGSKMLQIQAEKAWQFWTE